MQHLSTLAPIGFLVALFSVAAIERYLQRHFLDLPNERSSHGQPIPRAGGLSFIIAFTLTLMLWGCLGGCQSDRIPIWLWLSLIPLVLVSLLDDWLGTSAGIRYGLQLGVSAIAVSQCGAFPFPGASQLGTTGAILAMFLTLIGMTAFINFYNFMDGLDGLVAGVSAVQLVFLALWFDEPSLLLLVCALLGFLYWNWSPAKIFMGDVGSTFLGATVAIAFLAPSANAARSWSALAITLPLVGDAIYTLSRRLGRGENIFQAHRTHLYQRLQQAGWSHARVALTYIALTLAIGISVNLWGGFGAGISLVGAIAAIVAGEWYLSARQQRPDLRGRLSAG